MTNTNTKTADLANLEAATREAEHIVERAQALLRSAQADLVACLQAEVDARQAAEEPASAPVLTLVKADEPAEDWSRLDTAEAARRIRKALKAELDLNSRQVSVRTDRYSMGSSIRVEVKDARVSFLFDEVKAIAKRAEHVSRCQITGDILSGGNTYVDVSLTCDVTADVEAAKRGEPVNGWTIEVDEDGRTCHLYRGDEVGKRCFGMDHAVRVALTS